MDIREMAPRERTFIVNDEGLTCEIGGGKNRSLEDGYSYWLSPDGGTVYQIGDDGRVDGEYDSHASADDIETIVSAHAKSAVAAAR